MHEKLHPLMHINTHTNDSVAVTEYTSSPPLLFLLSREKVCGGHLSEDSGFPFWIIAHAGTDTVYITYLHQYTHTHTRALTRAYLHTGV